MYKLKNRVTGEERMVNKVLGDEVTLAKAQENASYYDTHNTTFVPVTEDERLCGFYEEQIPDQFWEIMI